MNAREALRALLVASVRAQTGEVIEVAIDGRSIKVRLAGAGVVEAKVTDATRYAAGDQAQVRDGLAQGKVAAITSIPVYHV